MSDDAWVVIPEALEIARDYGWAARCVQDRNRFHTLSPTGPYGNSHVRFIGEEVSVVRLVDGRVLLITEVRRNETSYDAYRHLGREFSTVEVAIAALMCGVEVPPY